MPINRRCRCYGEKVSPLNQIKLVQKSFFDTLPNILTEVPPPPYLAN